MAAGASPKHLPQRHNPIFAKSFARRCDEFGEDLRDDRVAVGAQLAHSTGNPMSQRECSGFSWPPRVVDAGEPFGVSPGTAKSATVRRLLSVLPASLFPFCAGVPAIGVGHPARRATSFSGRAFSPCLLLALLFQSRALVVGHGAKAATAAKSGPLLRIASMIAPAWLRTPLSASAEVGVGQDATLRTAFVNSCLPSPA